MSSTLPKFKFQLLHSLSTLGKLFNFLWLSLLISKWGNNGAHSFKFLRGLTMNLNQLLRKC